MGHQEPRRPLARRGTASTQVTALREGFAAMSQLEHLDD
jgi:hypothetical protein